MVVQDPSEYHSRGYACILPLASYLWRRDVTIGRDMQRRSIRVHDRPAVCCLYSDLGQPALNLPFDFYYICVLCLTTYYQLKYIIDLRTTT